MFGIFNPLVALKQVAGISPLLTGMQSPLAPGMAPTGDLLSQARERYPILRNLDLQYKLNPKSGAGFLEFWPSDEPGTKARPRPFPMGKPGIEVYSDKTRPIDILGDVVSHYLVKRDPVVKGYYERFRKSLTRRQQEILREQYDWAVKNRGERRSFMDWKEISGIPGYFRGYAFRQWPAEAAARMYNDRQLRMFDEMMRYLGSK